MGRLLRDSTRLTRCAVPCSTMPPTPKIPFFNNDPTPDRGGTEISAICMAQIRGSDVMRSDCDPAVDANALAAARASARVQVCILCVDLGQTAHRMADMACSARSRRVANIQFHTLAAGGAVSDFLLVE